MALELVRQILGACPAGFEIIEYVVGAILFIMVVKAVTMFFSMTFKILKIW